MDELHTLFLGVFQEYVLAVCWKAVEADVYKVRTEGPGQTAEVVTELTAQRLGIDLFQWYKDHRHDNPNLPVYELQHFDSRTFHTTLRAKAVESGTLVRFAWDTAKQFR